MNNAQIGDKILDYDNEQTTSINDNKDKIESIESSIVDLDNKFSKDCIINYGSNENGSWEKWNSGKLIQRGQISLTINIAQSWSSLYVGTNNTNHRFPIPFVTIDSFIRIVTSGSTTSFIDAQYTRTQWDNEKWYGISLVRPNEGSGAIAIVNWEATGTWK